MNEYHNTLQKKIIRILDENGSLARSELVKRTGSARTTVYDNLIRLEKDLIVEKRFESTRRRGRPRVLWSLTTNYKVMP